MVKVMPKNDVLRKLLRHPSNNVAFRDEGPMEWPNDSFTARRIADGDVTVVEEKKTEILKDEPVKTVEASSAKAKH